MNAGSAISHLQSCSSTQAKQVGRPVLDQVELHRDTVEFFIVKDGAVPELCAIIGQQDDFLNNWHELEGAYSSCCLGMVYRAGARSSAVCRLLCEDLVGGALPGAIVVMGYDALLVRKLSELVDSLAHRNSPTLRGTYVTGLEWPAILIVANESDSDLIDNFRSVSRLRELAVPIDITVTARNCIEPDFVLADQALKFLKLNLVRHFPRMF